MSAVKAERLILMAAGTGSRLAPLTNEVPKPLVKVNGKRMVDRTIEAALAAGIEDIVVVRGYKAPLFDELLEDYPTIRFVENDLFDQGNNVVSLYLVRDLLANAYVAEADLVLQNPELIASEQEVSNYLGVPCSVTDDWAFATRDEHGRKRIVNVLSKGGANVHHMFGISFWTEEDARKLKEELEQVVERDRDLDRYFEEIPLDIFAGDHEVFVRECSFDDIVEIDTLDELASIDSDWEQGNGVSLEGLLSKEA